LRLEKCDCGSLEIYKGKNLIVRGVTKNGLYSLVGQTIIVDSTNVVTDDNTKLWHHRLTHICQKGLEELTKQGAFRQGRIEPLKFCENCVLGRANRQKFLASTHSSNAALDCVHADLWGPSRTESHEEARYFLSLIDDFSRKVWVYFLKYKNEVVKVFEEWKFLVETQTRRKVKKLRTDNELEFYDERFKTLCKKSGTARHLTMRGTPQQNALMERFNRTILESVRCILNHASLPNSFWVKGYKHYCLLHIQKPINCH